MACNCRKLETKVSPRLLGLVHYTSHTIPRVERRPIQQLPANLVNRIAAGEVIERPASVVKELLENAIDAGATHITVEVEEGGKDLIRITDDGSGIPVSELPLAFAQHATSKLTCDEDLFRISTMGFRGEALASIGAVSHARIISRVSGSDAAYEILNRGGAISDPQAAAGNVGTTTEVRNLFFNTPARRKFLKGSPTELGHISEMVLRTALPYPQIAFELISSGRSTLKLPAGAQTQRLLAAWPDDFQDQRLELDVQNAEIRISGVVGLPDLARPTGKYQYIFLNGRYIRDKFIQHALKEAYRGLTEPGRYPAAILLIAMPPGDVDVNVHPTKIEVRFRDSSRVHGLVLAEVREKLLGNDLSPSAVVKGQQTAMPLGAQPATGDVSTARDKLAEFFRQHFPDEGTPPPANAGQSPTGFFDAAQPSQSVMQFPAAPASMPPADMAAIGNANESPAVDPQPQSRSSAIQLHNSYLIVESGEGLEIIDQHALHERILFEELKARLARGPLESQQLLIPEPVKVNAKQMAMLEQIQPMLRKLGIEAGEFGPDSIAVQAFPSFLHRLNPATFVRELLEKGEQEQLDLHEEELLHDVLDMMACKAAVKAGDALTAGEVEALLARRHLVDRSSNCPHGRPTTLKVSLKDLEKQFKRTGF